MIFVHPDIRSEVRQTLRSYPNVRISENVKQTTSCIKAILFSIGDPFEKCTKLAISYLTWDSADYEVDHAMWETAKALDNYLQEFTTPVSGESHKLSQADLAICLLSTTTVF